MSQRRENSPRIALSSGEPAGIGPDICIQLAREAIDAKLTFLGDPDVIASRAEALNCAVELKLIDDLADVEPHQAGRLTLLPIRQAESTQAGVLNPANASAVIEMLEIGARACIAGQVDALVTAPVQKSVINEAGISFSGHTEFLGELTGAERPVMLLASPRLRVALATTHLPLSAVPKAITKASLCSTIRVIDDDLRARFGFSRPRLLILGLNPHAGENGILGNEEKDIIEPAIADLRSAGIEAIGPVSADSAFTETSLRRCDVVVAMYHDQGLPVLKSQDFGEIVNVTLGLPIIRTSVDHGTALGLAGTGEASHASLRAAVELAIQLADQRQQ